MTTYAQLQADVIQYAARDDVSASVPMFIRLAEPEIYRRVRIMEMETPITFTCSSPDYVDDLPADFLGFKRLKVNDSPNPRCQYVGPDQFASLEEMSPGNYAALLGDAHLIYTIEAMQIRVNQPRGSTEPIELSGIYWQKPIALDQDDPLNPTNVVLPAVYDLFVFATLRQLWDWSDELEMVTKYERFMERIIASTDDNERMRRRPAGSLQRTNARQGVV